VVGRDGFLDQVALAFSSCLDFGELLLEFRDAAIGEFAGALVVARRCALASSARAWSSCSLSFCASDSLSFSAFQRWSVRRLLLEFGELLSRAFSRSFEAVVGLLLQRLAARS
jgi:hypothetical protein